MLAVILGILKVILTVVLVLLIAALVLIVLVLFVPVRYKLNGSFRDEIPDARAEAKWLLGILSVKASYAKESGVAAYVNLFGHKIYDILGDDENAEADSDSNIAAGSSRSNKGGLGQNSNNAEIKESYTAADAGKKSTSTLTVPAQSAAVAESASESGESEKKAAAACTAEPGSKINTTNPKAEAGVHNTEEKQAEIPQTNSKDTSLRRPRVSVYSAKQPVRRRLEELKESRVSVKSVLLKPVKAARKGLNKAADKISCCMDKAEAKLKGVIGKAAELISAAKAAFTKRSTQLKELKALWDDKRYAPGKALLLDRIVKLLLELKPRTGSGYVRIGTDDPYGTGQLAQLAAFLYPFYADTIEVIPDFDQSIIEGELNVGGRVRLIIPAEAALRVFFSKELKIMYKKARQILELD